MFLDTNRREKVREKLKMLLIHLLMTILRKHDWYLLLGISFFCTKNYIFFIPETKIDKIVVTTALFLNDIPLDVCPFI